MTTVCVYPIVYSLKTNRTCVHYFVLIESDDELESILYLYIKVQKSIFEYYLDGVCSKRKNPN